MKKYMPLFILIVVGMISAPILADAHVKWFANVAPQKVKLEDILSPFFMTISLLIAILLAILSQVMGKLMDIPLAKKFDLRLDSFRKYSRYILKYGTAVSFIFQVSYGTMFAPEFAIRHTWQTIVMWLIIIFLVIPHHISTKIAALLMLGLFISVWGHAGWFHMLDYGFYIAIIGVLLVGKTRFETIGFPFLYLGTGLSLCWVAVEKWVYPMMTIDIIHHHNVPTFGFPPDIFIVLSAFIEFVVGYLLVVGILNRVLAVVVTILFILTTTIFGYTEVVGHAMIHIVLIIFIIEGISFYNPPIKMHQSKLDQMIFVSLNFIFVLSTFLIIYYRFA
ncbi:DoxX family membrane protein [Metabacillus malikii]|uniref:Membrane protein YphA (DoxX/SURF4 family) n=1 Tax=Metabacillus malikii TaxID=1504265 RepID=A0ABT9ZGK8_9BACI|nr:DoxX family membrane protein [Metabacillus malikii]MDQ0230673.1 putative membrane protein YphA (DoxX/SURF4 family) [Metabacillus malikii]